MARKLNAQQRHVADIMGQMRLNEFKQICDNVVPCVYAAIAIALYEKGWRYERINNLFARSQEIWNEKCIEPGNMIEQCEKLTGIELREGKGDYSNG